MTMNNIMNGRAAEHIFVAKCLLHGLECYLPSSTNTKVNVVVGRRLARCQVKVIGDPNGQGQPGMSLRKVGCNSASNVKQYRYTAADIDFFVAVDLNTFECFVLSISSLDSYKRTIGYPAIRRFAKADDFTALSQQLAPRDGIEPPSLVLETRARPLDHRDNQPNMFGPDSRCRPAFSRSTNERLS